MARVEFREEAKIEELPVHTVIRAENGEHYYRNDHGWINVRTYWDVMDIEDSYNEIGKFEVVSLPIMKNEEDKDDNGS